MNFRVKILLTTGGGGVNRKDPLKDLDYSSIKYYHLQLRGGGGNLVHFGWGHERNMVQNMFYLCRYSLSQLYSEKLLKMIQ